MLSVEFQWLWVENERQTDHELLRRKCGVFVRVKVTLTWRYLVENFRIKKIFRDIFSPVHLKCLRLTVGRKNGHNAILHSKLWGKRKEVRN